MSTVVRFLRTKFLILIAFPLLLSGCGSTGGSGGYGSGVAYLDIVNSTGVSIFICISRPVPAIAGEATS